MLDGDDASVSPDCPQDNYFDEVTVQLDHVSAFYYRLSWLPLPCFIQFRSLCLMSHQYHQFKCIPLEPPIVFGRTSSYSTRTPAYFANIPICST